MIFWLYTIARNMMCDHWRKKKLACQSWEGLVENNLDPGMSAPEEYTAEIELIQQALAKLAPKLRQCLILREVHGYKPCEIASMLGIGETSVGTYISMARKQFHQIYGHLQGELERQDQFE
ncbi:MAG: hypothetical protein NVS3B14_07380 [Ktedonobacteraceae bacterium]